MPKLLNRTKQLNKAEPKLTKEEKRRIRRSAWRDEDLREVPLAEGVIIDQSVYQIAENRFWTLIIKGFVVYLITAGAIGCYLSAMEILFSEIIFHLVILSTAILCACLYHSWKSENLGYLIFFALYALTLFAFRDYINSGFYAIVNDTNEYAAMFFDTEGLQHYNERISNRYAAVTVAVCLIGIAVNILLNNYILRRARYMIAAFLGVTVNLIPLYMEKEPELLYSLMLIAGLSMTYILKCGRHFHLSRNDHIFKRRKQGLSYGLDFKSLRHGMLLTLLLVLVVATTVNLVRPRSQYEYYRTRNKYKQATKEVIQNVIMLGFAGLWNWYPNDGGLASGSLGGVSSIRLDYQPDLNITFTPYSYDTLYVKNLIGQTYVPVENYWNQPENYMDSAEQNLYEAEALKKAYESGKDQTAKGKMIIKNVAAPQKNYMPYYTGDIPGEILVKNSKEVVYYPLFSQENLEEEEVKAAQNYLGVPEANREEIRKLVRSAGITEEDDPMLAVQKLSEYYEREIPYTIRPGATPWRKDFINYFLSDNRKGYCAHFASAAVLAFRSVGIPARYCEGYAISYSQILSRGELVNGEKYSDYYDGYNALGETAVISINATDANAHAWVEIYVKGKGWVVAETTPSSTLDADDGTASFWEQFNNIFGDGDEDNAEREGGGGGFRIAFGEGTMRIVAYVLLGAIVLALLIFLFLRLLPVIRYHRAYRRGDWSEKLVLYYGRAMRRRRRDKGLRDCVNYRESMEYLYDKRRGAAVPDTDWMIYREPVKVDGRRVNAEPLEELIRMLEQAGFSNVPLTEEEFRLAMKRMDELLTGVHRNSEVKDEK